MAKVLADGLMLTPRRPVKVDLTAQQLLVVRKDVIIGKTSGEGIGYPSNVIER